MKRKRTAKEQRLNRLVLGFMSLALGLLTFVIGHGIWTNGDTGWVAHSDLSGESHVTSSYVLVVLVICEVVVLIAFFKTWRRFPVISPRNSRNRKNGT